MLLDLLSCVVGRLEAPVTSQDLDSDSFLVVMCHLMTYMRRIRLSLAIVSHLGDGTSLQQPSHTAEISSWPNKMDPPTLHPPPPGTPPGSMEPFLSHHGPCWGLGGVGLREAEPSVVRGRALPRGSQTSHKA
jgi:hypothetical protein